MFQKTKPISVISIIVAVLLLASLTGVVSMAQDRDGYPGAFDRASFLQVRQPLHPITANTPHGQAAVAYIEYISDNLYDRFPFTLREKYTAIWIVEELLAMGYDWNDIYVQEFTAEDVGLPLEMAIIADIMVFIDHSPFANLNKRQSLQSQNVILTVPGLSEEVIVVGAHYDSVFFPGASDNASGVALLLESAKRLINTDNYYTVEYVFFGAEELGLYGAYYYVQNLSPSEHGNILFIINADILLDGDDLLYMAGYNADGHSGANHITDIWDKIAQSVNAHHGLNLTALPEGVFGPSDQLAFLPYGHTAMLLAGLVTDDYIPGGDFTIAIMGMNRVLHSPRDEVHFIIENWPGKIETNMRAFSIFLEEIIHANYYFD